MKRKIILFLTLSLFGICLNASAQGTFVYDQQSSDESNGGSGGTDLTLAQPVGQSFTPSLQSVGFIRLHLYDRNPGNSLGGTVSVNLRSDSITGTILGTTQPITMPDSFGIPTFNAGYVDFIFQSPVAVQPGTTYYFQPVLQSGDSWGMLNDTFNYSGGIAIFQGTSNPNLDQWFREGVIVPEPSSAAILLLGVGGFVYAQHRRKTRSN